MASFERIMIDFEKMLGDLERVGNIEDAHYMYGKVIGFLACALYLDLGDEVVNMSDRAFAVWDEVSHRLDDA